MNPKQSFNLSTDFLGDFSSIFMKLVLLIVVVYIIIMILNFLRDKFLNKQTDTKKDDILELLAILNKLFFVSGFGFIIGNIVQMFFTHIYIFSSGQPNYINNWDYLTFGIILIFIGMGFKYGRNILKKENQNPK